MNQRSARGMLLSSVLIVLACIPGALVRAPLSPADTPVPTTTSLPPVQLTSPADAPLLPTASLPSVSLTSPADAPVLPTASLPPIRLPTPAADARFGAVGFGRRLNSPKLPCAELTELGIYSTFLGAWWGRLEPRPGEYDWSSVDRPVEAALACGVEPVIKITTAAGPGHDGLPPQDMDAYADFVFHLAQHLKGRVRSYAIENEIDNRRMVWTAETYGSLRAAAYQAVKKADPEALVLDAGLTMQAYIVTRADELRNAGQPQEAIDMLHRFFNYMRRKQGDPILPTTEQQLDQWLDQHDYVRLRGLVEELYAHPESYDAVQLHYLQDAWELLPEYVSWVRDWLARAGAPHKPIEFWEIGFGWEGEAFSEEGHAQGVVKTLVVALGEGASRVIYEPYAEPGLITVSNPASRKFGRGLVTEEGARLAATAFQTMASYVSGYRSVEPLHPGGGVWLYRFETPGGDVYVAWSVAPSILHLSPAVTQVTVTDISGRTTVADATALPIGPSPIFILIEGE